MAKNTEKNAAQVLEETKTPEVEQDKAAAVQEQAAPAPTAPTPEVPTTAPETPPTQEQAPELFALEELASKNRIPGWQSAALHKLMGWEPDKMVSEADYKAGLARLKNRRIGG